MVALLYHEKRQAHSQLTVAYQYAHARPDQSLNKPKGVVQGQGQCVLLPPALLACICLQPLGVQLLAAVVARHEVYAGVEMRSRLERLCDAYVA